MKTSIFVPTKINVGFNKREDTYTGKLAYIIYFDENGKLRKETSWENWRNKDIPNEIYDNEPMEGFVLNKKVGGDSWGWNPRQTYTRVYDPRGFEFEITIPNLLWILENCNCIKGKGLEGQFIYGWDGKELLLMPVDSPDYRQIAEYNKIVHNNESIRARDLVVGATYLTKENIEYTYIGKFDVYNYYTYEYEGKQFYFATKNNGIWSFDAMKSIPKNKLISCVDDKCTNEYADIYEQLEYMPFFSPYDNSKDVFYDVSLEDFIEHIKENDYYKYFISEYDGVKRTYFVEWQHDSDDKYIIKLVSNHGRYSFDAKDVLTIFPTREEEQKNYWYGTTKITKMIPVTLEEIYEKMRPICRQKYLQNGKEYERVWDMR